MKKLSNILPAIGSDNNKSLHIALVYGGLSSEREPSLMSGKEVIKAMKDMEYKVTPIDMGTDIAEVLTKINPDVVLNALHGTYGEDGCIQGTLEILGIPYTHSGLLASAIALDKIHSQNIFITNGIKCPKRAIITQGDDLSSEPIKPPYVIKPIDQGSSVGVEVIFAEDNYDLSKYDFKYGKQSIIEEYISGQEIQVAVLNGKAIGTAEIFCLQGKRFNDYDCKYKEGYSKHICPANLSKEASDNMLKIAEKAHKALGCKGITRSEFKYNQQEDQAYFLEINTHPGLTPLSSAPEIVQHHGMSFQDLIRTLIDEALNEKN
jgi:D-alanine-D-alanine ligase